MRSFFLPNWSPPDDPARPLPAEGRPWPSDGDDDDDDDLANEKRNLSVSVAVQLAPADCYLFDLRPHFHLHRYFFSPNFQMIFRLCVFFICLFSYFFFVMYHRMTIRNGDEKRKVIKSVWPVSTLK